MKKYLFFLVAAVLLVGCKSANKQLTLQEESDMLEQQFDRIMADSTLSEEEQDQKIESLLRDAYVQHKDDSLGLDVFITLITNFCEPQEAQKLYEEADELIRENSLVKTKIESLSNLEKASVGCMYQDVEGPDALTGENISISQVLAKGKPVLLDFWASWCGPCRREITNHLLDFAAKGEVNILGIAVWENELINTTKAMEELGVTWPVIYSGGRENSPSVMYGVSGIPTLILLDPDGKILGRGHSLEEVLRN